MIGRCPLRSRRPIPRGLDGGGAAKNLDWLCHDSRTFPVFKWAEGAGRDLDPGCVVPADVRVEGFNEVINGRSPPVTRIEQFCFEPSVEALTGRVIR